MVVNLGLDFGRRETHAAVGSNPLYRAYHDPNTRFGDQLVRLYGSYRFSFKQWTSITNAQVLTYRIEPSSSYITIDNPTNFEGVFYNYGASQDAYLEQFLTRGLGERWTLLAGMTFQFSSNFPQFDYFDRPFNPTDFTFFNNQAPPEYAYLDTLGVGPQNFYNIGALVDASYESKKWNFLFGLRLDQREFFGFVVNPRIGGVYKMNKKNRLRFNMSTAFRPPSTYLITNGILYYDDIDTAIGLPHPNKELKAELLTNVEVGWWHKFNNHHQFDVSAFYHVNQNHIIRTTSQMFEDGKLRPYYGFVNDENSQSNLFGVQLQYLMNVDIGRTNLQSDFSVQYAKGSEQLPFNRGTIDHYRGQPEFYAKWLIEWSLSSHLSVMVRLHGFSDWRTRSVVRDVLQDVLVAPAGYFVDMQLTYSFFEGMEVYGMINNLTNNYYYGIDATGGAGLLGNRRVNQDLIYNPQLLRIVKFGARIRL